MCDNIQIQKKIDELNSSLFKEDEKNNTSFSPYLVKRKVVFKEKKEYNPLFGDEKLCECGHSYYRHFDTYEDMFPCGCKYCECYEFKEKK